MFAWIGRVKRWWRNVGLRVTYEDRLAWVYLVMAEAEGMAQSSEVKQFLPEAAKRVEYLRARHEVVMPKINEMDELVLNPFTDSRDDVSPPLFIFPITQPDARISLIAAHLRNHAQPGSYSPHDHMIILGMDEEESLRYASSTLLHEAGHAMEAEREGRTLRSWKPRDERARLEEELRMWHFDCRLAGFLGGEGLRRQMEITAQEIIQGWVQGPQFQMMVGESTPLDICYGVPKGRGSLGRRTVTYVRYCELMALHMFWGSLVAHEHQLALMASICKNSYEQQDIFAKSLKK